MVALLIPRRIGRWSYVLRNVVVNLVGWPVAVNLAGEPTSNGLPTSFCFWVLMTAVAAYWVMFVALPRCRDAGLQWWLLLLLPVPIVDLGVFLILVGTGTRPEPPVRTTPPPLPISPASPAPGTQ